MTHCMVDLETMGNRPGCAITSIGAVSFDPRGDEVSRGHAFYHTVQLRTCLDAGLTIDASTVEWWLVQSDEARKAMLRNTYPLRVVLERFSDWWRTERCEFIWSHGLSFDIPILAEAFRRTSPLPDTAVPWRYWAERDTRTLFWMANDMRVENKGTAHDALDDAVAQAETVQKAWKVVHGKSK